MTTRTLKGKLFTVISCIQEKDACRLSQETFDLQAPFLMFQNILDLYHSVSVEYKK